MLAIEEKSEYVYRFSLDAKTIQFFRKFDVQRTQLEIDMLKKYYCRRMDGIFVCTSLGILEIIVGEHRYKLKHFGASKMIALHIWIGQY